MTFFKLCAIVSVGGVVGGNFSKQKLVEVIKYNCAYPNHAIFRESLMTELMSYSYHELTTK